MTHTDTILGRHERPEYHGRHGCHRLLGGAHVANELSCCNAIVGVAAVLESSLLLVLLSRRHWQRDALHAAALRRFGKSASRWRHRDFDE